MNVSLDATADCQISYNVKLNSIGNFIELVSCLDNERFSHGFVRLASRVKNGPRILNGLLRAISISSSECIVASSPLCTETFPVWTLRYLYIKVKPKLTFHMRKGTKQRPGTVSSLLHVIALGGLVDLWVELLLRPCMAVAAAVAGLAVAGLAPLLAVLHVGAWCTAVFVFARRSAFVL